MTHARRLSALLLTLTLAASQAGVCAGWIATAEARMACCADGACPMHKSASPDSKSGRALTQAEADSCCATSEREQSSQSSPTLASTISLAALGTPTALPPVPAIAVPTRGSGVVPLPPSHVPKHVLLSLFLV